MIESILAIAPIGCEFFLIGNVCVFEKNGLSVSCLLLEVNKLFPDATSMSVSLDVALELPTDLVFVRCVDGIYVGEIRGSKHITVKRTATLKLVGNLVLNSKLGRSDFCVLETLWK